MGASFAYLLEIMGHQAHYLFDARYILTKVDEYRPQVAFVDICMEGLDGFGLARTLRDYYARHELRLVALSQYGDERTRSESMTAGFDAYLAKPVKEPDVKTILSVVFDERLR